MKPKVTALTLIYALAMFCLNMLITTPVDALEYQSCTVSEICNIGEFLYDDEYSPITTATCNITSRYPDGTLFLNNQAMSLASGGRYYYDATIGTTQGIYPTQVCCTSGTDYMCIDKTFKVVPAVVTPSTLSAADVWNYGDRSLTSFGSLVSDIWGYSTRTVTNMGDFISGVWSNPSRTITSSTSSVSISKNELRELTQLTKENRKLLEQLVNKPIITTFIDENTQNQNLKTKVQTSKNAADQIYGQIKSLKSKSETLSKNWTSLSQSQIKDEVSSIQEIITKENGILASTKWLHKSWNNEIIQNLNDQADTIDSKLKNLIGSLDIQGKSNSPEAINTIIGHLNLLDAYTGESVAATGELNLYGYLKSIDTKIAILDQQLQESKKNLLDLNENNVGQVLANTDSISKNITNENIVPFPENFINSPKSLADKNTSQLTKTKNKLLGLIALINTNKLALSNNAGQPINSNWLEEGSLVFRTVASNPSTSLTQTVEVKFYLPTEIKTEQIMNYDSELKIDFDPIENALYAHGTITLTPQETRTFIVETEDIWQFSEEEISIIKKQTNELADNLKGTNLYTQASSLRTDINVTLDKILLNQKQAIAPENRIKTYRESKLEMVGVEEKISSLRQLIAQSGGQSNLLGFVGGVQIVAIWGIIIIVVAGFVFLALYMRALKNETIAPTTKPLAVQTPPAATRTVKHRHKENKQHIGIKRISHFASILFLITGLGSLSASTVIRIVKQKPPTVMKAVETDTSTTYPYTKNVYLASSTKVPVMSSPSYSALEVYSIKKNQPVYVFKKLDNWLQIGLDEQDNNKSWWIDSRFTQNPNL